MSEYSYEDIAAFDEINMDCLVDDADGLTVKELKEREDLEVVDVVFHVIPVVKEKIKARRDDLVELLARYPDKERLKGGPSYIELGGAFCNQRRALVVMGVGQAAGLWKVITPATMGIADKKEAYAMAGMGLVMISGFEPEDTSNE